MKGDIKKLIGDIQRDKDLDKNLCLFMDSIQQQYNYYSAVKLSMNYYTMREMVAENRKAGDAAKEYFITLSGILGKWVAENGKASEEMLETVSKIRNEIEQRMEVLTSFTDGYEVYEYILNRLEAGIKGTVNEGLSPEQLSAKVFNYIFSENDAVVVNSKLQLVMSQLPVRMTKNKFYDVVTNTLEIYKGGDKRALRDFVDMLRKTALLVKPSGFSGLYPDLYETYELLRGADYKNMTADTYDLLTDRLSVAAEFIEAESTMYILLQEIVNDSYAVLLTDDRKDKNLEKPAYKAALNIISACIADGEAGNIDERVMDYFVSIEGVQEDIYESLMLYEAAAEDILTAKAEKIDELGLKARSDKIKILQKLVSTSLFASLEPDGAQEMEDADMEEIASIRKSLTEEFAACFSQNQMLVNRSIMSKLFSAMPIFFNTQQEIKDYLDYVLCGCSDKSELTACNKLLCELMEKE
ncbi:MAG: hypothetical protein NC393_01060 [Clostridium sp.]|nr:hypothetical protein [Clostridium sp.]MCM1208369.1 hypothetical protein [Ruminococcus sp.]